MRNHHSLPMGFIPAHQQHLYSRPYRSMPNGPRVTMRSSSAAIHPPHQFTVRREAFVTDLDHQRHIGDIRAWCSEQVGHDPRYWSQYMDVFFVYEDDLAFAFRMRWA